MNSQDVLKKRLLFIVISTIISIGIIILFCNYNADASNNGKNWTVEPSNIEIPFQGSYSSGSDIEIRIKGDYSVEDVQNVDVLDSSGERAVHGLISYTLPNIIKIDCLDDYGEFKVIVTMDDGSKKTCKVVRKGPTWRLSTNTLEIPYGEKGEGLYLVGNVDEYEWEYLVESIESSNDSVIAFPGLSNTTYGSYGKTIDLEPSNPGTTVITVHLKDGSSHSCTVKCLPPEFIFSKYKVTFSGKADTKLVDADSDDDLEMYIKSAYSTNRKVAVCKVLRDTNQIEITAKKRGTCSIIVKDSYGEKHKIKVVVKKSWEKAQIKLATLIWLGYGDKRAEIEADPGAIIKLRVGGNTYRTKIGKKGKKIVKVKKHYKVGKIIKVTAKYKGVTAKWNERVQDDQVIIIGKIKRNKKTVKVKVYRVAKGDKVILEAGGVKYKKKIKKDSKKRTIKFKTRKKLGSYKCLEAEIVNKYGQSTDYDYEKIKRKSKHIIIIY